MVLKEEAGHLGRGNNLRMVKLGPTRRRLPHPTPVTRGEHFPKQPERHTPHWSPVLESYCQSQRAAIIQALALETHLYLLCVQAAHCFCKLLWELSLHKAVVMIKLYSMEGPDAKLSAQHAQPSSHYHQGRGGEYGLWRQDGLSPHSATDESEQVLEPLCASMSSSI